MSGRSPAEKPRFSRPDALEIVRLRAAGVPARRVGQRYGRTAGSIYRLCARMRSGEQAFSNDALTARRERIEWLFSLGVTIAELARIYDCSAANIHQILDGVGLDPEMRAEVVAALPPVARRGRSHGRLGEKPARSSARRSVGPLSPDASLQGCKA